ncbi:unnamed protein product [Adineta steineri]|uniref:Solute carrier family 25 member 40 n=1 Tax=Adineta steineri TaxID=433720 RepID=A0A813WM44_9BILA|nr:unnamed protein product [Adineta steineri]
MANNSNPSPIKPYQQIIASGSGAVLTALFMTPFDVIKVRLQSQTSNAVRQSSIKSHQLPTKSVSSTVLSSATCRHYMTHQQAHYYTGTIDTLSKIVRAEGFRVLWSGLTPALCVSIPTVVIYFTSYMKAKQLLGYNEKSPNPILPVIAGACSRIFAVTTVSPFELFRTKMQSEKVPYRKLFQIVRTSLSEEGPRVLWRGLLPTLWRDIPFSMVYWFNYESLRAYLVRSNIPVDSYATFACGALAGGIAATLTTPADVAKTYRQIDLGRKLWSGLTPALCVSIPTVVIYFTSYMKAKQLLGYNEKSPNPILPVIAGACSRIFAVTTVSPFELFRTKMQSEKVPYRKLFQIVRTSLSEEGPRVLWRGLLPTLWRDIPFSMVYWFNYESLRAYLVRSNIPVDSYATFACGALAGGIAATLTTPADVAKTYRQIDLGRSKYSANNGCINCSSTNQPIQSTRTLTILLHILRVEGPKGLFAGLVPRLLKVAPACAIMITSFESLKTFFQRMNTSG